MDYKGMATPDFQDRKKINAKYAGIVSRPLSRLNFPEADFFEIIYFDNDDNQWHCGFGSYNFLFVSAWLKSEFEPTYNRLETAITDLLSRAEAAEARAEKAEKQLEALSTVILGEPIMTTGQREVITFCGIQVDEAMGRVVDYPILKEKLEKAERCIDAIEDDLDRGNDNDWARGHIAEWREGKGNHQ